MGPSVNFAMHWLRNILLGGLSLILMASSVQAQDAGRIKTLVDDASKFYKEKEYETAGDRIEEALFYLGKLADKGASETEMEILKTVIPRLKKAREVLSKQGVLMSNMIELTPEGKRKGGTPVSSTEGKSKAKPKDKTISFARQVAPILLRNCGGCHVQGSRGEVNFSSFSALTDAGRSLVVPGSPDQSHALEVIEAGQMPPKQKLSESDVKLLRKWIEEGAKFDGDDETTPMSSYARR